MKLTKIRLAGFKSFVDPTTVHFHGNLVGVVGPNGCGKSNIMDAVRWVMGESSAKMLRGESMTDVIFNGSAKRQPVGMANIELIFDNTDGRVGGAYADYAEISVRRQLTRDGQSTYFLNGGKCRRRDIQDLFLGTGLGPRSYSIIEQGMISRVIEARPEDLRLFVEEAAGISLYRERRRETELRVRHTRENLDRVKDLRQEVGSQLNKLERQAQTARKYQELKSQERALTLEIDALRWRALDTDLTLHKAQATTSEQNLAVALESMQQLTTELDDAQQTRQKLADHLATLQGSFFQTKAEISRVEQALNFGRHECTRRKQELLQLSEELASATEYLQSDQKRRQELADALTQRTSEQARLQERIQDVSTRRQQIQQVVQEEEQKCQQRRQILSVLDARQQRLDASLHALQRMMTQNTSRQDALAKQLGGLEVHDYDEDVERAEASIEALTTQLEEQQQILEGYARDGNAVETEIQALQKSSSESSGALQQLRGQLNSLEKMQQQALKDHARDVSEWLSQHDIDSKARLHAAVEVEQALAPLVESLLGDALAAARIPFSQLVEKGALHDLPTGLVAFDAECQAQWNSSKSAILLPRLGTQISSDWPLHDWLGDVWLAPNLAEALRWRHELAPGARIITPEGIQVGSAWLRVPQQQAVENSVLWRANEISRLKQLIVTAEDELRALLAQLDTQQTRRHELQQQQQQAAHSQREAERTVMQEEALLQRVQLAREEHQRRHQTLTSDIDAVKAEAVELAEEEAGFQLDMTSLQAETQEAKDELAQQETEKARQATVLQQVVEEFLGLEQASRALDVQQKAEQTQLSDLENRLQRSQTQLERARSRQAQLRQEIDAQEAPLLEQQDELETYRETLAEQELALEELRKNVATTDEGYLQLQNQRQQQENQVEKIRENLQSLSLRVQELVVRKDTLTQRIEAEGVAPETLLSQLASEQSEALATQALQEVQERLQRLGAVNLTALEEFKAESERKAWLDTQYEDIQSSLDTLEQAMRKIDRETRTRFQETFTRLQEGFQRLFPQLFGGGEARLDLTDDDLLETGVTVMARPPGKRNASIHLLSGGEKALTAVALVFAIFELNPSPFCILDEVDAPLDDANVARFCEMLKKMSAQVQFIFVTHNKVAMEIANQLLGITMHEPGCSRLVSVDVEEAVRLAGA